jgi:hypothetical protein
MFRKGVEFALRETEPGRWKWSFQIGESFKSGRTETNLMGMAAHRVRQRIDLELRRKAASAGSMPRGPALHYLGDKPEFEYRLY